MVKWKGNAFPKNHTSSFTEQLRQMIYDSARPNKNGPDVTRYSSNKSKHVHENMYLLVKHCSFSLPVCLPLSWFFLYLIWGSAPRQTIKPLTHPPSPSDAVLLGTVVFQLASTLLLTVWPGRYLPIFLPLER